MTDIWLIGVYYMYSQLLTKHVDAYAVFIVVHVSLRRNIDQD